MEETVKPGKTRKKVERQELPKKHNFVEEPTCVGIVKDVREITTRYGNAEAIDILDSTTGKMKSIMISAGLKGFEWRKMVRREVEIVFTGYEESDNGLMMTFEVYILE